MHRIPLAQAILFASVVSLAACSTATEPEATLALSTPPSFSAIVSRVEFESGNSPNGPLSQYNIWVVIPPAATASTGVVVGTSRPVFARSRSGRLTAADASDIKVGSTIEVWHDQSFAHGLMTNGGIVQGPPGARTYSGEQIVIVR
jgi:hypothetical protein